MSSSNYLKKKEKPFGFIRNPFKSGKSPSAASAHSGPASHTPTDTPSARHSDASTTINVVNVASGSGSGSGSGRFSKLLNIPLGHHKLGRTSPTPSRPVSSHNPTADTPLALADTNIHVVSGSRTIDTSDLNASYNTVAAPTHVPGVHTLNPQPIAILAPAKNEAFEKALRAYVDGRLSDDVKKDFQSASDIMERLQMMQCNQSGLDSKVHISSSISDRVKKVLQCLRHFMGSVAICIQHSPEISSLVIGGVNCILTVRIIFTRNPCINY